MSLRITDKSLTINKMETTVGDQSPQKIDAEFFKKIIDNLTSTVERKGYIMMPSIAGFDLYEISEDRLRSYLTIEHMKNEIDKTS